MCFSAEASFLVAAATGLTGVAAMRQTTSAREIPLAGTPLLFGLQQFVEGVLWLRLPQAEGEYSITMLSFAFLVFAEVIWPAYTAIAVLLIEPDRRRRQALIAVLIIGIIVSRDLLLALMVELPVATIRGHSIAYGGHSDPLSWEQLPYLAATVLPLFISSQRAIRTFGVVASAGFLVSACVYAETFVSVWCFFAAAGSVLLYLHFRRVALALPAPSH